MDYVKAMEIYKRMTAISGTNTRRKGYFFSSTEQGCESFIIDNPKEVEVILEQWAKDHPRKTYRDDFLEKFPNAGIWKNKSLIAMWCNVYNKGICTQPEGVNCRNCPMWDKEINNDI